MQARPQALHSLPAPPPGIVRKHSTCFLVRMGMVAKEQWWDDEQNVSPSRGNRAKVMVADATPIVGSVGFSDKRTLKPGHSGTDWKRVAAATGSTTTPEKKKSARPQTETHSRRGPVRHHTAPTLLKAPDTCAPQSPSSGRSVVFVVAVFFA